MEEGYASSLLAGNALATHDLEDAYLQTGQVIYIRRNIPNGHYHHLNPINAVHKYGSLPFLIENEGIDNGIIYSCVEKNVLFVLVGSIRDDELLPEVFPNVYQGQDAMRDCVRKTIIVIYCLCLGKGVSDGLNYYLNPDFRALGVKGVLAAMGQAFYSLSLGMGIMVSYGSYTGANIKVGKSVFMIALFDTIVALLAGLAIFPAIYHYQAETGVALQNNGIVMMFSSLPIVFNTFGAVGKIMSFFFLGMVTIAAITSVISLLEVVTQFLIQKYSLDRKKAIVIIGIITFLVSVPIGISLGYTLTGNEGMTIAGKNWLDFFDLIANTVLMPVCALGSCVALGWFTFKGKTAKERF